MRLNQGMSCALSRPRSPKKRVPAMHGNSWPWPGTRHDQVPHTHTLQRLGAQLPGVRSQVGMPVHWPLHPPLAAHSVRCAYTLRCPPYLQIEAELHSEGPADGAGAGSQDAAADGWTPGKRLFRVALRLAFPAARAADCSSRARELLRSSLAAAAGVSQKAVSIERVVAPTAARPHLGLLIHVKVGSDLLLASRLAKAAGGGGDVAQQAQQAQQEQQTGEAAPVPQPQQAASQQQQAPAGPATPPLAEAQYSTAAPRSTQQAGQAAAPQGEAQPAALLGGHELLSLLGQPDAALCSAEVEDVTPACAVSEAERAEQDAINRGDAEPGPGQDRRLAVVRRFRGLGCWASAACSCTGSLVPDCSLACRAAPCWHANVRLINAPLLLATPCSLRGPRWSLSSRTACTAWCVLTARR